MKKKWLGLLITLLFCTGILAACGDADGVYPNEIAGASKSFTLDVYGNKSVSIDAVDYIDANGVEGLSFTMTASESIVSVSNASETSFIVTAVGVGNTTAALCAVKGETLLTVSLDFTVVDSAPGAPVIQQQTYGYDKSAGGDFELPVIMNGGAASLLRLEGLRLNETFWRYNPDTRCVVLDEAVCLELAIGDHSMELITTGGSVQFVLQIINSVVTSFDEVTDRSAELGKAKGVSFSVDFNGATVRKITYGDYVLDESEYAVTEQGITIRESFYSKTTASDDRQYKLYLSNNDSYSFTVTAANQLFYTDYDVTTIHNELQSTIGHNPLYQDSTRVQIVDAPEGSGMQGQVLKFTPHTEDVNLNVHGIYTLAPSESGSTWQKVNFVGGRTYAVSFDYITEGTTEGENFRFRAYTNSFASPVLDTGSPGARKTFRYEFTWNSAAQGVFLYGKFINGGSIFIDNFRLIEIAQPPSVTAGEYTQGDYTIEVSSQGFLWDDVRIDGASVSFDVADGQITIGVADMEKLSFGRHVLALVNPFYSLETTFVHTDVSQSAELTELSKTFTLGTASLKLAGTFDEGVAVTSLTRKGSDPLDTAYAEAKPIATSYVTVESDGIVLSGKLLEQVYDTCTYEIVFSNANSAVFTLTSNGIYFTNFDETMTWNSSLAEDTGVAEVVAGVDGFDGNVLKVETKNWNMHDPSTWFTRVFCFSNNDGAPGWRPLPCESDKYYEISFDMKVLMNGATHSNLGYYYTVGASGEKAMGVGYTDEAVHRVSIILKGSDFAYFAIGLDPRDGDLESILYIDNFGIKETIAS